MSTLPSLNRITNGARKWPGLLLQIVRAAAQLSILCGCLVANAADIPWSSGKPIQLNVKDQPLPDLLASIFKESRVPVIISEAVKGSVTGTFNNSPKNLFRDLVGSFGLNWFYDGHTTYIYVLAEDSTRAISLPGDKFGRMKQILSERGILDPRFRITWYQNENHLLVAGPPRYVAMVDELARIVELGPTPQSQASEIRVFRLRHAWAKDINSQQGGREQTIPGVATLLRRIVKATSLQDNGSASKAAARLRMSDGLASGSGLGAIGTGNAPTRQLVPLPPVSGLTASGLRNASPRDVGTALPAVANPDDVQGQSADTTPPTTSRQSNSYIEADQRLNAVIISDTHDRMVLYDALIRDLDVPISLVEIEAAVIDMDVDDTENVGVSWRFLNSGHVDVGTSNNASSNKATASFGGLLGSPVNFLTSVIAGSSSVNFSATLDAMVRHGKARISARPRVLTLDNSEAVLESQQNFYVRVAGRDAASLYQVSTGLMMRVTPQVTREGNVDKVKMLIDIQDGSLSSEQVDQIPVVTKKSLNTQAVINVGDSLLIGGYVIEESIADNSKVPVLGDVPILGGLFSHTAKRNRRVERIFLITPRLLQP